MNVHEPDTPVASRNEVGGEAVLVLEDGTSFRGKGLGAFGQALGGDALLELGIDALTVVEIRRFGSHEEHKEIYRAAEYDVGFMPRTKIEFAVSDELAEKAVETLRDAAVTGEIGDGRIYVLELSHTAQIRSGKVDADVAAL